MKISAAAFRVYLSPLLIEDAEAIAASAEDSGIMRENFSSMDHPFGMQDALSVVETSTQMLANRTGYLLGVHLNDSLEFAGVASINAIDNKIMACDIGYWLAKEHRGRGYATESIRMIMHLAFSELRLNKVIARTGASNARSIVLLKRLSFTLEGTIRRGWMRDNELVDYLVFGMLASEYRKKEEITIEW